MRTRSRGRVFYYYRRNRRLTAIPGEPGSPGFLAAYQRVHAAHEAPGIAKAGAGTLRALVAAYRASPQWRALRASTRKDYDKSLDPLADRFGHLAVATMPRQFVIALKDEYATKDGKPTPRRANSIIGVLRLLLAWGVDRGWRKDNPALRPKMMATTGGHRPWTQDEVATFLAHAGVPEPMKRAVRLALGTGQRKGDLLVLSWAAYDGRAIHVKQSKTGAELWIPAHRDLRDLLDGLPRTGGMILVRADGKPWKADHFNHTFAAAVKATGLSGLVFHGLRHTAATWLADAGCTPSQIASITGHKTLAMVSRYTEAAGQRTRATEAVAMMERHRDAMNETSTAKQGANKCKPSAPKGS